MAIVRRDTVRVIAQGLDHPESVCAAGDGSLYAGGEAGQVYRVTAADGAFRQVAATGGFVLGLAPAPDGGLVVCDCGRRAVLRVDPATGDVRALTTGLPERPMALPNHPAFDAAGNLYVSDSGDYWAPGGTGVIFVVRPDGTTELFHPGPFRFPNGVACSPDDRWLYVAQSTAGNIVRVPLARPGGPVDVSHVLPAGTIPDGIAALPDGSLLVGCYKPDAVLLGTPDGSVVPLLEDPTGELLNRPTNLTVVDDVLYVANLGGWHLTAVPVRAVLPAGLGVGRRAATEERSG